MLSAISLFVIATVFLSAALRGMAGFGFALITVPVLSLVLPPVEAVTLGILLQVIIGTVEVIPFYAEAHKPSLYRLAIGSLAGTPIGILALTALSPDTARILIALAILVGLGVMLRGGRAAEPGGNRLAMAAGLASGVFSGLAAIPGPPAVAYYLGTGISAAQTRASLLIFCFFTVIVATPGLLLAGAIDADILWMSALCVPALFLGTYLGGKAFERLKGNQYRSLGLVIMGGSAALVGWRGLTGIL